MVTLQSYRRNFSRRKRESVREREKIAAGVLGQVREDFFTREWRSRLHDNVVEDGGMT